MALPTHRPGRTQLQFTSGMAVGCVVLFLLPFAAAGTFSAVRAVRMARAGVLPDAVLLGIAALAFGGVGFGGLLGIRVAYRRMKEAEALQARHPEEPWLWRRDWAAGRIEDSTRETLLGAWIFAILWNLISLPGAYVGVRAALYEAKPAGLVALLFPLAGVWLLARALHATARKRKYGISRLELSTIPGVIGHTLVGTVHAPMDLRPAEGFEVHLTCIRRVTTRSGKNSSTSERILWQEEGRLVGELSRDYSGMRTSIPIRFQLPPDVEASTTTNPNDRVTWQLQLTASVSGVDYDATFEVPVFRTAASDQPSAIVDADSLTTSPASAYRPPANSPVTVTRNPRGTEILFPAGRTPGPAIGMTVFLVIWWGALLVQIYLKAPLLFPIVTGLFGILIAVFAMELWLKVSRVIVGKGTLTVASGYLAPGRERTLTAAEVADVIPAIGMQAGKTVYYDVVIRKKNGRKVTAGHSVRDKREAEWLAATIKQSLGI
jgi:hypothetical protein